jgi:hypothetical protein
VSEALDINEENVPIKDKEDYKARLKAIQDILVDPNTAKDPLLKKETMKRKAELEKEAEEKGFTEGTYGVMDEEGFVSDFRRGINKIDRASEKVSRKKLDHNISTDPEEKRKLARDVNRYNKVLNKPKNRLFRPDDLMGAGDIKEGMAEATGDKKFDNILGNIVKDTPLDYVLSHPRTGILFKRGFKSEEEAKAYNQKKKNGFYSVYPYQWWRDEIEPAIPDFYRKKGVVEGSDISGLLAASHLNKSFIITAELAEGGTKKFRVKAQSERVAKEKFMKHHSMAKIVDVKEEGVSEDLDANQKRAGQLGPTEKVGPKGAVGKLVGGESAEPKDEMLEDITDIIKLSGIKKG